MKQTTGVTPKTVLMCPRCGKRTHLSLRAGDATVYCRNCKIDIEISIRVVAEGETEETANEG